MRRSFLLALVAFALVFSGCDNDAISWSEDDTPKPDSDLPDGDQPDGELPDGDPPDGEPWDDPPDGEPWDEPDGDPWDDSDGGSHDHGCGNPCDSNRDCSYYCSCDRRTWLCTKMECDTVVDCFERFGDGCWECDAQDFLCYLQSCGADSDCCTGAACLAGVCVLLDDPCVPDAAYIKITSESRFIAEGETVSLSAAPFNENDMRLPLLGEGNFNWSSSDDSIVSVADGVVTGGSVSGEAVVTAELSCSNQLSASISFRNFAKPLAGSRVIVYDAQSGQLLSDVPVFLNDIEVATVDGVAKFAGIDCAENRCNLHVFPATHSYVSAFGLGVNDILIPVSPNVNTRIAGGVKGHQDPSAIPEILQGDIRVGLSMFSIPGNLADVDLQHLLDPMTKTLVRIGATIDEWIILPSGMEGYLNETTVLKDGYQAVGAGGKGTLWGLGGYTELTEVLEIVTKHLDDETDSIDALPVIIELSPILENFYHGIMTGLNFAEIPKVRDLDDINNNGDTSEFMPDLENFHGLEDSFRLTQAQTQNTQLIFGRLPEIGDGCADSILTVVGALETGVGFIPLGLNVALDEDNEATDCRVGSTGDGAINAVFAPQHSGVVGYDYTIVSVALSLGDILESGGPLSLSAAIGTSPRSPETFIMPGFLGVMSDASWDAATHNASASPISGATLHRIVFTKHYDTEAAGEQRSWQIYWPGDAGGSESFELPPSVLDDRSAQFASAYAQAFALDGVDYDGLFGFNATNLDDMNPFLAGFSLHAISASANPSSGN